LRTWSRLESREAELHGSRQVACPGSAVPVARRAAPGTNKFGGNVTRPGTVPRGTGAPLLSRPHHGTTCPLRSPAARFFCATAPHPGPDLRARREAACPLPCRYDGSMRPHGDGGAAMRRLRRARRRAASPSLAAAGSTASLRQRRGGRTKREHVNVASSRNCFPCLCGPA
jgi:hypothetical protein